MTEDEIRAKAVREAAAYLERIYRRGLQSRDSLLADLDSVAFRMEQGMTARGNMRRPESTERERDDIEASLSGDTPWDREHGESEPKFHHHMELLADGTFSRCVFCGKGSGRCMGPSKQSRDDRAGGAE